MQFQLELRLVFLIARAASFYETMVFYPRMCTQMDCETEYNQLSWSYANRADGAHVVPNFLTLNSVNHWFPSCTTNRIPSHRRHTPCDCMNRRPFWQSALGTVGMVLCHRCDAESLDLCFPMVHALDFAVRHVLHHTFDPDAIRLYNGSKSSHHSQDAHI